MRMIRVAALMLVALAAATLTGTSTGVAREYPWCAHYAYDWGVSNCGFDTIGQCMATVSGIGGFCERNPFYQGAVEYRAKPRRKHRRRHRRL